MSTAKMTKPYQCNFIDEDGKACGQSFRDKWDLNRHTKGRHNNERNYTCEECDETFKYPANLAKHVKSVHTMERPFPCPEEHCPMAFLTNSALLDHLGSSSHPQPGVKWIKCRQCFEPFETMYARKKHEVRFCELRPSA